MVKANMSFGGKLLLIFLTIVIYTIVLVGGIVGGAFYVYKKVKVSDLVGMITSSDGWISSEYDDTLENFIKTVSETLKGEITIDKLSAISPKVEEAANKLLDNVENIGLFRLDRETLYSLPVNSISGNLSSVLVVTATLGDLSEKFGFSLPALNMISGSQENPVWFYTQANKQNEDGSFTEIGKEFTYSETGFSYFTRSLGYFSTYTEGETVLPVVSVQEKPLYALSGVTESDGYLAYNGSTLYLKTRQETQGGESVFTRMTKNNDAVYGQAESGEYLFLLSEEEDLCVATGPAPEGGFTYASVKPAETAGSALVRTIALPYRYTPLYAKVGEEYLLATQTDENGQYVIDKENGGYAISDTYKSEQTLYYADYVYSEELSAEAAAEAAKTQAVFARTNGIASLPLTYAMNTLAEVMDINNLTLGDFEKYFGVQLSDNVVLENILYVPLSRFSEAFDEELQNVYLSDVLTLNQNSPRILLFLAYGNNYTVNDDGTISSDTLQTIGSITNNIDTLKISDVISVTQPDGEGNGGSPKLLLAIKDWTLKDFNNGDKINSLSLGDVIDISEEANSPKILLALKDVAIGNIGETVNNISLGEILDLSDSDTLLSSLKNSTLGSLADDIAALSVQTMFSDSMYEQTRVGELKDLDTLKAKYGDELYISANGGYIRYSAYTGTVALQETEPLYSPYMDISGDVEGYSGIPLYYLKTDAGVQEMTLATGITAWKLPQTLPEGVTADTPFYTPNNNGGYDAVTADGDTFGVSSVWYFDKETETMAKLSLEAASYGVLPQFLGTNGSPNVTLFSKLTKAVSSIDSDGSTVYYTVGNLFRFDVQKESWVRVNTVALRDSESGAVLKDEFGNVKYVLADGENPSETLYTYGKVTGIWKYLMYKDGEEQSCSLQTIDSLVTNVGENIKKATVGDLYYDGLINITPPDGKTVEEMLAVSTDPYIAGKTLGTLTLGESVTLIYKVLSAIGG